MSKMNPVVHFEMPAENKKSMAEFYTNAFGWKVQQLGPEMGDNMTVYTSGTDEKGHPKKPGEPGYIPGVGLFFSFIDTEGNRVSMLQPSVDK